MENIMGFLSGKLTSQITDDPAFTDLENDSGKV